MSDQHWLKDFYDAYCDGKDITQFVLSKYSKLGRSKGHIEDYAESLGSANIGERYKFSQSANEECSDVGASYNERIEREIAEYIIDWWISKKSFNQWFTETILQQKLDFDDDQA